MKDLINNNLYIRKSVFHVKGLNKDKRLTFNMLLVHDWTFSCEIQCWNTEIRRGELQFLPPVSFSSGQTRLHCDDFFRTRGSILQTRLLSLCRKEGEQTVSLMERRRKNRKAGCLQPRQISSYRVHRRQNLQTNYGAIQLVCLAALLMSSNPSLRLKPCWTAASNNRHHVILAGAVIIAADVHHTCRLRLQPTLDRRNL